ncbi:MAG TPA: tRNA lysidine(34) synthetase TilS [Planctomycetaceae bacterium]|nr:tRNA lysidine(34) synthetase TilS [Planctomycetaceae bacterium]
MGQMLSPPGPVTQAVENFLRARAQPGERWLAAVSGGADSVALLAVLRSLLPPERLVAAHLNHQLRGAESDDDAAWVVQLCHTWNVPLVQECRPVATLSAEWGVGLEEGARRVRYDFLQQTALQQRCRVVALAHTATDQAETVLHHLLRGTGLAGLQGIPAERPLGRECTIVRPLLDVTRGDITAYLQNLGQDFRTDSSNLTLEATRNRLRRELLPHLRAEYNPQIDRALVRLAHQAAEAQVAVLALARRLLQATREPSDSHACVLAWQKLQGEPQHALRELFVALWQEFDWPRQKMGFDHWNRLVTLLRRGGRLDLPGGVVARRDGRHLLLDRIEPDRPEGTRQHSGGGPLSPGE